MLRKLFRFHGQGGVKRVYRAGHTVRDKYVSVKVAHNQRRDESRVAIVVSKKVSKSAPTRNRIRRRIYEIIRNNWDRVQSHQDIVLSVYDQRLDDKTQNELQKIILGLFEKAGIIKR